VLQAGRSRVRFQMISFRPHYGPGVDSTSNRHEYQVYFLGVRAAGVYGRHPYHHHVPTVSKSGSLNLLEPSGLVQVCSGIALPLPLTSFRTSNIQIENQCLNIRSTKHSNVTFSRVSVSASGSDTVSMYCHMKYRTLSRCQILRSQQFFTRCDVTNLD
jgi:hypothetical protein